jgi:hypothetical protein
VDEPVGENVIGGRRVDLDTGHLAVRERRFENIRETARRRADKDDGVAKDCGIDVGLLAGEELLLRIEQVDEGVGRIRAAPEIVEQGRAAKIDRTPEKTEDAVVRFHAPH